MDSSFQSPTFSSLFIIIIIIFTLIHFEKPSWAQSEQYKTCSSEKIRCGHLANIGYPFYGLNRPRYCGYPGFELECQDDHNLVISIMLQKFYVIGINDSSHTLHVAREDYYKDYNFCQSTFANTTINFTLFDYTNTDENITLYYGCSSTSSFLWWACNQFPCPNYGWVYFSIPNKTHSFSSNDVGCKYVVVVPVYQSAVASYEGCIWPVNMATVSQAFQNGFGLEWHADNGLCAECHSKKGECGYHWDRQQVACYIPGESQWPSPSRAKTSTSRKTVLIAGITVAVVAALLLGCCGFFILLKRNPRMSYAKSKEISAPHNGLSPSSDLFSTNGSATTTTISNSQNVPLYSPSKSDIEKGSTYFGVKVFSYAELEQATNNFDESRELGDGGFGVVYYGELPDGRPVAVKRLFENNITRAGQFNNEIEILAHLRHKNLVTLYGCSSRRSRELLLVYEYIPNGTVADHLHGKLVESGLLTWPIRLNIAVETADALAYLHASDVIHRDVKTTNVLLDKNFEVKVADFGLSRLFPSDVTHVSTAPQGTPGYVDPEYYQVYRLTEKSDVYSFGVVLIELISSKRAMDPFRPRLDINLANMAIDRIQNQKLHELVDPCLGFDRDNTVRDMIKLVAELAFKCLQQQRDLRPSMVEVVEVLRGIQKTMSSAEKQVEMEIKEDDDVGS